MIVALADGRTREDIALEHYVGGSAVTLAVQRVEQAMGAPLFERGAGRKLNKCLTPEGEKVMPFFRELMLIIEEGTVDE
jgi:DNA-binding transcriptional LysR family regulator